MVKYYLKFLLFGKYFPFRNLFRIKQHQKPINLCWTDDKTAKHTAIAIQFGASPDNEDAPSCGPKNKQKTVQMPDPRG